LAYVDIVFVCVEIIQVFFVFVIVFVVLATRLFALAWEYKLSILNARNAKDH
jgi:hypothetical protein